MELFEVPSINVCEDGRFCVDIRAAYQTDKGVEYSCIFLMKNGSYWDIEAVHPRISEHLVKEYLYG